MHVDTYLFVTICSYQARNHWLLVRLSHTSKQSEYSWTTGWYPNGGSLHTREMSMIWRWGLHMDNDKKRGKKKKMSLLYHVSIVQ